MQPNPVCVPVKSWFQILYHQARFHHPLLIKQMDIRPVSYTHLDVYKRQDARRDIALIYSFDDDQIGSKMTTNFVLIHSTLTIKQAMRELVNQAAENDNISTIYVEDENDVFCGAISLNELIIARADMPLSDLIVTSYPFVYAKEDIDAVSYTHLDVYKRQL